MLNVIRITHKKLCKIIVFSLLALFLPKVFSITPYSNKELEQLEKEFLEQINQSNSVLRDPFIKIYLEDISKKMSGKHFYKNPDFFVVKSTEINAFAGPGGHIGINTALILATIQENELAAVMAHEMAHVRLYHLYRLLEHEKQMKIPMLASALAAIALGVINPTLGSGALMASLTGFAQDNINFIRANEKEADRIGMQMLLQAGFNPDGMINFFKKMQLQSRYYYTTGIPAILRTHPLDEERIAEAQNRIPKGYKQYNNSSLDYILMKELVRVTTGDPKSLDDYYKSLCKKSSNMSVNGDMRSAAPGASIVCIYGSALLAMQTNKYPKAQELFTKLHEEHPENIVFTAWLAKAMTQNHKYTDALIMIKNLYDENPDNYAIIMIYAELLIKAKEPKTAYFLLLKASRIFNKDLAICEALANAAAANNDKAYAYFAQAQCKILQGLKKEALQSLNLAKKITKDTSLKARIDAKIADIKFWFD